MQIQVECVDIARQVGERVQPTVMLKREIVGGNGINRIIPTAAQLTTRDPWLILQHQLPGPDDSRWSRDEGSAQVRIPLFDYLLPADNLDLLLKFGTQTGALAVALIPPTVRVRKLVVILGNVFLRPDGQPGYQVWAGYALCIEKE